MPSWTSSEESPDSRMYTFRCQMDTKHLLLEKREDHLNYVLKQSNKTKEEFREGVDVLKAWLGTQPHLPETPSDEMLECFYVLSKFSVEGAKQKLDMYYSIRSIVPDFYENKNPKLPNMQRIAKVTCTIPLPKLTKDGYRVILTKWLDDDPDNFDPYDFFSQINNVAEVRLQEDLPIGDIVINDLDLFKLGHFIKFTPTCLKKIFVIVEKVYGNRLKGIYYINPPPFMDRLVSLLKPLMKPKLARRLHVFKATDELYDYIPRDILPKDYGGEELSLKQFRGLWKQKFAEYKDRFDALETFKIDEDLRPDRLENDDILGFYGNFKKLNVD
ncbi:hypothetical protein NQ317_004626 [Molorchus minor]|uniref:CRAL-TRIO domain-containing protein n=1 Tax=Molorchus minor TaxID=1323400 RepID=A0ABQ9JIY4_9CUCU|nr:hypothetical protein NQ317_004626 [Molorchus minor]